MYNDKIQVPVKDNNIHIDRAQTSPNRHLFKINIFDKVHDLILKIFTKWCFVVLMKFEINRFDRMKTLLTGIF